MHQYLFFIGDFPIRAYGLILSLSIILATGVAYFLAKQDGRYHGHIIDMGIYCGIAAFWVHVYGMSFSLTGTTTKTTFLKSSMYGKAAWPYKAAYFSVLPSESSIHIITKSTPGHLPISSPLLLFLGKLLVVAPIS